MSVNASQIIDQGDSIYRIVKAIKKIGPRNCSEISRETGVPVETVRYKINKQLIDKGVTLHVNVDFNKIGLARNWTTFRFTEDYDEVAPRILDMLSKIGYLVYYARTIPQDTYVSIITVPPKAKTEYKRFLDELVEFDVLESYEMNELAWIRYQSMREKYYNFDTRSWIVDWEEVAGSQVELDYIASKVEREPMIDKADLFILKELQLDCTKSIADIAEKLQTNAKTLRYHFAEHVMKRGLAPKYIVRWYGKTGKDARRWILDMSVRLRDPTRAELLTAQSIFHKLPFTWFDSVSTDGKLYLAYAVLPVTYYVDTLGFLRTEMTKLSHKFEYDMIDYTCAKSFTIPYEMYDDERGWTFDSEETAKKLWYLMTALETTKKI